ncbi:MAG TPA: DUF167 domain-containing protein [bacterium]|nr:DUF167 domain-containing protein [bacterium]
MRITVHVTPRARRPGVERRADGTFHVAVSAAPHEGEANEAVVAALAGHFGVGRGRVRIVRGHRGRHKLVEVDAAVAP